jgi:hypothetical protein
LNGLIQLERIPPECLIAEGIKAENAPPLLNELFGTFINLRVKARFVSRTASFLFSGITAIHSKQYKRPH